MNRANVLILDEFRMLDKNTIDTVLKRFLGTPRQPLYLTKKEYKNRPELLETNIEMYMSSCWYKSHWSFDKSKAYTVNLLGGRDGYFVCALPYQMAIKEGLKKRIEIEDEMSEADFDQATFDMEMGCLPFGDADGAFFTFDDVSGRRKLKTPMYPPYIITNKTYEVPKLVPNERRILSVDVALMASTSHKNDASAIMINSAIPTNTSYTANIVYMENHEGLNTDELALVVRRLFKIYKCTDLCLDTMGSGLGVFDKLIQDMIDPETGELYHALSCCNDKDMALRCKVDNAPKVIWSIKGSAAFNNEICILLRNGFQTNKINLLVSEFEAEEILKDKIKGFTKMPTFEQVRYKMPYVHTTLLVNELIKLEYEVKGANVKIKEKTGMRKDRYSSLAYNYWVQCQLEREVLRKQKQGFDAIDYASKLKKFNYKPISY